MEFDPATAVPDAPTASFDPASAQPAFRFSDEALRAYKGKKNVDVVLMSPDQYLALSPPMETNAKSDKQGAALKKSLDAGDAVDEIPALDVTVMAGGKAGVTDQDGRHRALFAKEAGLDQIPVAIRRFGKGDIKELAGMGGQRVAYDFKPAEIPLPKLLLENDPNKEYGTILPTAVDKRTGKVEAAFPEMIRQPVQAASAIGQALTGDRPAGAVTKEQLFNAASLGAGASVVPARAALAAREAVPAAAKSMAETAREAGFVLPPARYEGAGGATKSAAGFGGDIKTGQLASMKNQEVVQATAKKDLGLAPGQPLSEETFENFRKSQAQVAKAVVASGVPIKQDMQFVDDLLKLGPQSQEMAKYFPKTAKNELIADLQNEFGTGQTFTAEAGMQAVRRLRYKSTTNLKNFADPEKTELGFAQRGAADGLERLIERNLAAAGKPELMQQYRTARQLIAKSHDLEAATTEGGAVNPQILAKLGERRPLTGGLKLVADMAKEFPEAFQNPAKIGGKPNMSPLDWFAAMVAGLHGHPMVAGAIAGRPGVRSLLLSEVMQNRLARAGRKPQPSFPLSQMMQQPGPMAAPGAMIDMNAMIQPQPAQPR